MNNSLSSRDFSAFFESLRPWHLAEQIAVDLKLDPKRVECAMRTGATEAEYFLTLLQDYNLMGQSVLEVGAGTGLLGHFLLEHGIDVVMLEPGDAAFPEYAAIFHYLNKHKRIEKNRVLECPAEAISAVFASKFDFIFSNNVLEHVKDVAKCLESLNAVLKPAGVMLHNCPNYAFPYEPHYGLPLLPLLPRKTGSILPARISQDRCWQSLNFITGRQVKRIAKTQSSFVNFRSGSLFESMQRLLHDEAFRSRHVVLYRLAVLLEKLGLITLLRFIPADIATPMVFEWRRSSLG